MFVASVIMYTCVNEMMVDFGDLRPHQIVKAYMTRIFALLALMILTVDLELVEAVVAPVRTKSDTFEIFSVSVTMSGSAQKGMETLLFLLLRVIVEMPSLMLGNALFSKTKTPLFIRCDIIEPIEPGIPTGPSPGNGCDCWKHVDHYLDITCIQDDTYTCTSKEGLLVTFKGNSCSKVKSKAKSLCGTGGSGGGGSSGGGSSGGGSGGGGSGGGGNNQCECSNQVLSLCDVHCIGDNLYICAAEPGTTSRSEGIEVIKPTLDGQIARWGGGVTTFVSVKFTVETNSSPDKCEKVIAKTGCARKGDPVCPTETEGVVIETESKCRCMSEVAKFREVTCIAENTYVCLRTDGETARFAATDCDWIKKNEMDCATTNRPFCPRWGGSSPGVSSGCTDPTPDPECYCDEQIKKLTAVVCVGDDTFVCIRDDGKEAKFTANKKQCEWIERNQMGCSIKPQCHCDEAISRFAKVDCIDDDKYRCQRQDGKLAKFSGTDCDWIYRNKMSCKLAPGPAKCRCDSQVKAFASVKCVKHDTYRCKREDGELAEFSGIDCDWITRNKMDCAPYEQKPTKVPKPTEHPNKTAEPRPPKCRCDNEVSNFSSVACISDNFYKCRKSSGIDVTFNGNDCAWVVKNVMNCDIIYTQPAIKPTPAPLQCPCKAETADFSQVECIGSNYYICKRHDGKDAKFEATDCSWVSENKMGCAKTCSCSAETSMFAEVECIGPDHYMCTRHDGQKAKV